MKHLALAAAILALPLSAQGTPAQTDPAPSPNQIVEQASAEEWVAIPADHLLVMTLAPDRDGNPRQVVIQLMPAPFSQGWIDNIRILARAGWYDGITINRVQDNYVVQWGDPNSDNPESEGAAKPLPEGLKVMREEAYTIDVEELSLIDSEPIASALLDKDRSPPELSPEQAAAMRKVEEVFNNPESTEAEHRAAIEALFSASGLFGISDADAPAYISIQSTRRPYATQGWHQRDSVSEWVEFWRGWPIGNFEKGVSFDAEGNPLLHLPLEAEREDYHQEVGESRFWPVHCYGMVGVGRGMSPDTGSGAELYTVIGHAPRHLDRNIALVGRIVEGMEYLSSLPRGSGALGFYTADEADKRTPILSVRLASDLAEAPVFEYLSTESETFERYIDARANRRDPFFIVPAGGADICNVPVPVRRVSMP